METEPEPNPSQSVIEALRSAGVERPELEAVLVSGIVRPHSILLPWRHWCTPPLGTIRPLGDLISPCDSSLADLVPFAMRDLDVVACVSPGAHPTEVLVIDLDLGLDASVEARFDTVWDWLKATIDLMRADWQLDQDRRGGRK